MVGMHDVGEVRAYAEEAQDLRAAFFQPLVTSRCMEKTWECYKLPFSSASTAPLRGGSCLCPRHMPDICCFPVHGLFLNFLVWTPTRALPSIGPDCPPFRHIS